MLLSEMIATPSVYNLNRAGLWHPLSTDAIEQKQKKFDPTRP
jgi:hypothetical protein